MTFNEWIEKLNESRRNIIIQEKNNDGEILIGFDGEKYMLDGTLEPVYGEFTPSSFEELVEDNLEDGNE